MKKRTKCPLCGYTGQFMQMKEVEPTEGVDLTHLFGEARWQACPDCHFVFQLYEIDESLMFKYYSEDYRLSRNPDFPHINDYRVEGDRAIFQVRFLMETMKITDFIKSVLDIGCNLGGFIQYMQRIKHIEKFMGVEPAYLAQQELKRKNIPFVPTIYDLDDTQYDLVNVSHVLEHFIYPLEALRDYLYPRVKPGKYLLVEVPNMNKSNAWCSSHISAFKPETLAHMVTKAGFNVLRNFLQPYNQNLVLFARRSSEV